MIYVVKIKYRRIFEGIDGGIYNKIHTFTYSSCTLNDCKFEAIKYLTDKLVKVISITFSEE